MYIYVSENMFHYSNEISLLSLKKPTKILQKMDTTRRHALNSQDKKNFLQTFFQQIPVIPPPPVAPHFYALNVQINPFAQNY